MPPLVYALTYNDLRDQVREIVLDFRGLVTICDEICAGRLRYLVSREAAEVTVNMALLRALCEATATVMDNFYLATAPSELVAGLLIPPHNSADGLRVLIKIGDLLYDAFTPYISQMYERYVE